MIKNNKGFGGFVESMVAVMIVTVCVMAFVGLFAYAQFGGTELDSEDFGFVEKLHVENGEIVGDVHGDLSYLVESNGYSMAELKVGVAGSVSKLSFYDCYGSEKTENVTSHKGTFDMKTDDGRTLLANYEVVIWQ